MFYLIDEFVKWGPKTNLINIPTITTTPRATNDKMFKNRPIDECMHQQCICYCQGNFHGTQLGSTLSDTANTNY